MHHPAVRIIGRILLALIFLMSAVGKIMSFQPTVSMVAMHHIPAPAAVTAIAIVLELVGGLMVIAGLRPAMGAVLLMIFLVVATIAIHFQDYRAATDMMARTDQMIHIMKNISIFGGLLYLAGSERN
jgi:putative oxidoreductase